VPEVSVVVAAHDQVRWIGDAIESVRAQTFTDWELVVVDDGSTDGTADIVRRHAAMDARIRCLVQPRSERSIARNRGLAATSGPLVAFLDADDRWRPEKLARQLAALAAAPAAGFCYTVARFVDPENEPLPIRKPPRPIAGDAFAALLRGNVIILASVVARRACLDTVGGFDPTLPYGCEDWDLWLRLARRWLVAAVEEELTLYRRHPGNTRWEQVLASALEVIDRWYDDPETATRAGLTRRAARARHFLVNAAGVASDDQRAALALIVRALREAPASALTRSGAAAAAALLFPRGFRRARSRRHST